MMALRHLQGRVACVACGSLVARSDEGRVAAVKREATKVMELVEREIEEDLILPLRDTAARFAGYAHYLAYSSDVGESFRAVLPATAVRATYGVAGLYMLGDVFYNGYVESHKPGCTPTHIKRTPASRGRDEFRDFAFGRLTLAHSALFQFLASLTLPFLVIHNTVHLSEKYVFQTMSNVVVRRWGPSVVALSIIPGLPLADGPIESAIDYLFEHRVRCPKHPAAE